MNRLHRLCWLSIAASVFIAACGGSSSGDQTFEPVPMPAPEPDEQTRSFAMGFTPWPYDASIVAINFVYSEVNSKADIIAHQLDGGIPWQEALDGSAYPAAVEEELDNRIANTSLGQVYLTLSPLNSARDNLADYWNDSGTNQALGDPWDSRDFDSEEVIQAYTNFAKHTIDRFNPTYFNFALEVSELALNDDARFDKFVVFIEQVSGSLRQAYPDLKLMLSVALKSPESGEANIINTQVSRIVRYVDVVGVSVYPYAFFGHPDKGDPANLPANWLSQIETISSGKPIAITETGWIAEQLDIPRFALDVSADGSNQNAYLRILFEQANSLELQFIIWFSLVDYDALWNGVLGQDDVARIWRDTGLYDENLNPRTALTIWQEQLDIKLAE